MLWCLTFANDACPFQERILDALIGIEDNGQRADALIDAFAPAPTRQPNSLQPPAASSSSYSRPSQSACKHQYDNFPDLHELEEIEFLSTTPLQLLQAVGSRLNKRPGLKQTDKQILLCLRDEILTYLEDSTS